jgi:hypothetical protein
VRFSAAIRRLVHDLVIAFVQVDRLQDVEVKRVFDLPIGVLWRELDVDNHGILGVVRIELAERFADNLFVGPDSLEGVTAKVGDCFDVIWILVTRESAAGAATRTPAKK